MAAKTDSNQVDPNTEMEELLAQVAGVIETLMHDNTLPHSATNTAWVALELIERAQVAHAQLWASKLVGNATPRGIGSGAAA